MTDRTEFEHTFVFTRDFLWSAFKRDVLWRVFVVFLGLDLILAGVLWLYGNPPWESPAFFYVMGVLSAALVSPPVVLRNLVRKTYDRWSHDSPSCEIHFRFTEASIEVTMPSGSLVQPWKELHRLWRYKDVWLLEIVKMRSILIPAGMPREVQDFVSERCRASGVMVKP